MGLLGVSYCGVFISIKGGGHIAAACGSLTYNTNRPYPALDWASPNEFASSYPKLTRNRMDTVEDSEKGLIIGSST